MRYYLVLIVAFLLLGCNDSKNEKKSDTNKGIAQEVLHVRDYSYIRLLDGDSEKWIAAPTTPVEIGTTYYYGNTMEMKNFESKDLNRKFETIYFVERIAKSEEEADLPMDTNPHPVSINNTTTDNANNDDVSNNTEEAIEITIEELYVNKNLYANSMVRIKGEVTKFNPAIMRTNWIHIEDGTSYNTNTDVTVTSPETVTIGDKVTIEGKVILDKDFGAGYFYEVLVDNAKIVK